MLGGAIKIGVCFVNRMKANCRAGVMVCCLLW